MYHIQVIKEGVVIEHRMVHEPITQEKEREIIGDRDCWLDIERIPVNIQEYIAEDSNG